jgi:hypothetical protein
VGERGFVVVSPLSNPSSGFRRLPKPGNQEARTSAVLTVYDILGREVSTLVNGWNEAGVHKAQWNADGLASGVYCYRLQCGSYTEAKTMTLLR